MSFVARTGDHSPADRVDYWSSVLSRAFVPLAVTPGQGPLAGTLRTSQVGGLQIAEVTGSSQIVHRDRAMIRRADPEYYKIGLQVRGRGVVRQDGREAVLSPGEFTIYDTSRPYRLVHSEPFHHLVLMCPRTALKVPERTMAGRTAVSVSGRHGMGALVAPFLSGLAGQLDAVTPAVAPHLNEAVLDMLAAVFTEGEPAGSPSGEQLLPTVRRYIDDHLGDPDLTPDAVAAAHHISPRYLRKLFERDNETVAGWIRARRLEHCRRDLGAAQLLDRPVSAVAARWGLLDAAHFSRSFRAAYGVSPRDYRLSVAPRPTTGGSSVAPQLTRSAATAAPG
jgi:AraC-like DNA-binding protein